MLFTSIEKSLDTST